MARPFRSQATSGLSLAQVEGIAATLPLGYLVMLWVPVACEARWTKRGG